MNILRIAQILVMDLKPFDFNNPLSGGWYIESNTLSVEKDSRRGPKWSGYVLFSNGDAEVKLRYTGYQRKDVGQEFEFHISGRGWVPVGLDKEQLGNIHIYMVKHGDLAVYENWKELFFPYPEAFDYYTDNPIKWLFEKGIEVAVN